MPLLHTTVSLRLAYRSIDPQNSPAAPSISPSPRPTPPSTQHIPHHPLSSLCLDRFQSGNHLLTKTHLLIHNFPHPSPQLPTSPTIHTLNPTFHQFLIFYQLSLIILNFLCNAMVEVRINFPAFSVF